MMTSTASPTRHQKEHTSQDAASSKKLSVSYKENAPVLLCSVTTMGPSGIQEGDAMFVDRGSRRVATSTFTCMMQRAYVRLPEVHNAHLLSSSQGSFPIPPLITDDHGETGYQQRHAPNS